MGIVDVNDQVKEAFNLPNAQGALVQTVTPGKPADEAGVKAGDIVTEVDGHPMRNNRAIIDYISYLPVGTNVKLTIIRNGERKVLTAKTAERPPDDNTTPEEAEKNGDAAPSRNKLGMSVQNITPQTRQLYGIDDNVKGVVVASVKEVSPAGEVLNEGDVISEVQGKKINNVDDFRTAIDATKSGQTIRIYVTSFARGGSGGSGQSVSGYRFIRVP
jgi:serine protease Do